MHNDVQSDVLSFGFGALKGLARYIACDGSPVYTAERHANHVDRDLAKFRHVRHHTARG